MHDSVKDTETLIALKTAAPSAAGDAIVLHAFREPADRRHGPAPTARIPDPAS